MKSAGKYKIDNTEWNPVPKGAIHSTKISGTFWSKTQWIGSVQPEKFRKNWSTF